MRVSYNCFKANLLVVRNKNSCGVRAGAGRRLVHLGTKRARAPTHYHDGDDPAHLFVEELRPSLYCICRL